MTTTSIFLNVNKMKKLVIDFRKKGGIHTTVIINHAEMEKVENFIFLDI